MTTSSYQLELATEKDDADLRAIMRQTPMEGRISVGFRREPSYFAAAVVEGDFRQVVAAREQPSQRLVGFGARSLRRLYVNGSEQTVGYLSTLRLLKQYRNIGLIARGYSLFRRLHEDGRTPYYLTTIADGNETAVRILTSGRAGLPQYLFLETYHTLALPTRALSHDPRERSIEVSALPVAGLDDVLRFWRSQGPQRQFFPSLAADNFFSASATYRDLSPEQLLVARRKGEVVGTFAVWDQSRFRQSVVEQYSRSLALARPFYNALAKLRGAPPLPAVGQPFHYLTGALLCVKDFEPAIADSLLAAAGKIARSAGDYLLVGLAQSDPCLPHWRRHAAVEYVTRVYLVAWNNAGDYARQLDGRPLYLELGCL
jgi:hypothetical protein